MSNNKDFTADKFYTEKYGDPEYLALRREDANRLAGQLKGQVFFDHKDKILDAGCGTGEFSVVLRDHFKSTFYGIELNKAAINKAQSNGLKVKNSNIESKWPYPDNFFDAVLGIQMIEHLVNPDHFIKESRRVLKKNGKLIITTPNLAAWFNRIIFLLGYQPFFTEVSTEDKTLGLSFTRRLTPNRKPLGHLRCFTLPALKDLLHLYNFDIEMVKGSSVSYFPKYMAIFDKMFSLVPSLSADLVIVAKK